MKIFGERLQLLRNECRLTQAQACKIIGISERNYRKYEAGTVDPRLSKLILLADYFNVSLDYLAGRTEEDWMK